MEQGIPLQMQNYRRIYFGKRADEYCVWDFLAVASCTISKILLSLLSLKRFYFYLRKPYQGWSYQQRRVSPFLLVSGLLSPVSATVLNVPASEFNSPSKATFSPALPE